MGYIGDVLAPSATIVSHERAIASYKEVNGIHVLDHLLAGKTWKNLGLSTRVFFFLKGTRDVRKKRRTKRQGHSCQVLEDRRKAKQEERQRQEAQFWGKVFLFFPTARVFLQQLAESGNPCFCLLESIEAFSSQYPTKMTFQQKQIESGYSWL